MILMRQTMIGFVKSSICPRRREHGSVRVVILVLACLFLGFVSGALWYYRVAKHVAAAAGSAGDGGLSHASKEVLQHLGAPIDIRFYALLDPASTSDALRAFAGRVDALLSEFQHEARGKLKVTRYNTASDAAAKAASADGLKPFNLDKGEACYLGLTVACQEQRQTLPQLSSDWEQALESDLTRALLRVLDARPATQTAAVTSTLDVAAADTVRRYFPDLRAVSVEDGKRILTEAALKDFKAALDEMEVLIKQAEDRFTQAEKSGSAIEQQAALKQLQQVRSEQAERSKQIAQRLQAQVAALERLKAQ